MQCKEKPDRPRPQPQTTFREFQSYGKLGVFLDRRNLAYTRIQTAAVCLKIPVSDQTRAILIKAVRQERQPIHLSHYQIAECSCGRLKLNEYNYPLFSAALQMMGVSWLDLRERRVTFARLSFASWAMGVTDDPAILQEVAAGLKQQFPLQVNALRISKWINGHSRMWGYSKGLLREAIECLLPECGEEIRGILG